MVLKGHFKQVPKGGRKGKGEAEAGQDAGKVVAFPARPGTAEAEAMERARQALEDYTERLFREQQAGIL